MELFSHLCVFEYVAIMKARFLIEFAFGCEGYMVGLTPTIPNIPIWLFGGRYTLFCVKVYSC